MGGRPITTKAGSPIDADYERRLTAEAEAGFDPAILARRPDAVDPAITRCRADHNPGQQACSGRARGGNWVRSCGSEARTL